MLSVSPSSAVPPRLRSGLLLVLTAAAALLIGAPVSSANTTSWPTGPVPIFGSSRIAADTSGNVYAYDTYSGMLTKYTGTGTLLGTVGPRSAGLVGVVASPDGGVYVLYTNNPGYKVSKYDGAGTEVLTFQVASGTGPGQASQISGFGADGAGNVYILDWISSRVEKFLANGSYATQWGAPGTGNGQFDFFNNQGALAAAGDGTVYVSDATNRIQKFTSTGDFLTAWGSTGLGVGQFVSIGSLAVDSAGNVYAGDLTPRWTGSGKANGPLIQEFDSSGNYLGSAMQVAAALTTYGNNLVYGMYGNSVYRLELTIPDVSILLSPFSPPGTPSNVYVDQPLTATATASVPFGSITGYAFDFGAGGPPATGPSPTATMRYQAAGTFRVTVTARSSRGGVASAGAPAVVNPRSPANTSLPAIAGLAVEGRRLTETHGSWNYGPLAGYSYRWMRCDRGGGNCNPIGRATSQSYVVAARDVGHTIRVTETATNTAGLWGPAMSRPTAVVKALPKLSALSVSPNALRAGRGGALIKYKLSMAATVKFTMQRAVEGRQVGRRCDAPTRSNRKARHCTRFVPVRGGFTMTGRVGNNSFPSTGRLSASALAAGKYRLVATPSAHGVAGIAQMTPFTILR
jgi:PKD domain